MSNTFIFSDDILEFEPYDTLHENFMHWLKPYMQNVFSSQSKRLIKDKVLHTSLVKKFAELDKFEDMRIVINNMSRNGFKGPKTYFNPCNRFYDFLIEYKQNSLANINNTLMKHFLSLELEGLTVVYKKTIYVAIKQFISYIEEKNSIKSTGTEHYFKLSKNIMKVIGKEKKSIAYLKPYDEYYKFLESIPLVNWHKEKKARNALMLKVLLITGIRVGELTAIKLNDLIVNTESNTLEITIIGKGNKKRTVTVAYRLVEDDFKECELMSKQFKSDYLFSTSSGKAVNDRYLNTLVVSVMMVAGIAPKDKNGPHLLRHSCATWLSAIAQFDMAKLQVYMAHEDIQTTKKYVHLDDEVVKEISLQASEILGKRINQ